jgi:ABC-type multidrug transport system ATPase subunit
MASLDLSLYPQLTVREHFETCARLRGCEPRSDELSEEFGLAEHLDRHAGELSTGMRNRLKLALAVQPMPSILLLDKPGASLDDAGRSLVDKVCADQRDRGVLMVATNDPSERRLASLELRLGD